MGIKFIAAGILCILLCINTNLVAQSRVESTSIAIMKYKNNASGLLLGDSMRKAIKIFGNPSSISSEYSEMDEKQMTLYKYGSNNTLYFMDGRLIGFELAIGAPFTVGKIKGPAITKSSSSIPALGWNLEFTKQQENHISNPLPGGSSASPTECFKSGDIFTNDANTDSYFQIRYLQNGIVKSVMVASR